MTTQTDDQLCDISIIIVNYNVKHFLEQCLNSIYAAQRNLKLEIIVVDNASSDDSVSYLSPLYPKAIFIENHQNVGFGKANNQALSIARGKHFLILNPDTILSEDSLYEMSSYLDNNPKVGAITPKILNREGGFDKDSKRGLPTPWVSFCRISGLSRLLPKSKTFGGYDLLYLSPDEVASVDALAGCCMFVRKEVYIQTGGFDEDFFMYGEDIDWSYRIKKSGWENHYAPVTKIVHYKGESTRRSTINRDRAFYGAMHLFVEKHFKENYSWLSHRLIDLGIMIVWGISRLKAQIRNVTAATIDLVGIFIFLLTARYIRTFSFWPDFGLNQWGSFGLLGFVVIALIVQSLTWVLALAGLGAYSRNKGRPGPLITGVVLGFLINSSLCYFFKQFAYSRFAVLFAAILGIIYILLWRSVLKTITSSPQWQSFLKRRAVIVGIGETARSVWERTKSNSLLPYFIVGFIKSELDSQNQEEIPILGESNELFRIIEEEEIEEVIFACDVINYEFVMRQVSNIGSQKGISFKIITKEILNINTLRTPFLTVDYASPRKFTGVIKSFISVFSRMNK